jgi:hypothetical protein
MIAAMPNYFRSLTVVALFLGLWSSERASAADPAPNAICDELAFAALANALPAPFFIRLIWEESRFDPWAISRAGAQGIAQFMPPTAVHVQLSNPFDPASAILKSAQLLARLRGQFGNLGLAAAAYNAGPKRVSDWLAGRGNLPRETVDYVRRVTGHEVTAWRSATAELPLDAAPVPQCAKDREPLDRPPPRDATVPQPAEAPWGVQLVGDRSEMGALATFHRMQAIYGVLASRKPMVIKSPAGRNAFWYRVRIGTANKREADLLCSRLRQAGGSCLVQPRN